MSSPVEEIGPATNLQDVQMTLVESLAANKTRLLEQNSLYHKFIVENLKMIQRLDDISARTSKAIEESGKKAIAKISQQLAPQDPTNVLDFLVPGQSLRSPQDAATQVLAQDATKTLVKKTVDGLENAKETQIKELPLKKRIKNFR